ncbi:hypothetical protein I6H88_20875 [Elizabethkingia bruuniana]|uniref:Uncharacterized protein n=1 Tax=Elizabethkingia bruuniana TaxID=1756149 RepID=A0A7T7ZXX4_9FLAO|nr:hypothetical protein [Elizabethkingia bruuniana]KGO09679.1 hypothetical protein KS04_14480 [Elizabethkingia miricola]AQX85290.1 hypothetical protein AYC65_09845 [Elizabethkingia bruuniana]OPB70157.1 hypothetical protein BAY12_15935 [Elizabethkingia bruuniana]QDZ62306.1 hypothetical protein EVD20_05005 [Elizabethkingia bruuniana]QQN58843.1 hypothetical protein I6H88_20875 [Elizabethkingia bruuniana]
MKTLNFLVLGKNKEILEVLKRLIENNEGWNAELLFDEDASYEYLKTNNVDILLLSSGLDLEYEQEIKKYTLSLDKDIKVIDHYGGGSGLLKNEVYSLFPDLNS